MIGVVRVRREIGCAMSSMEGGIYCLQTLQFEGSSSRIDRCLELNGHWLPDSHSTAGQLSHQLFCQGAAIAIKTCQLTR